MRRSLATLALAAALFSGCAERVEHQPWLDLAAALPLAEIRMQAPTEDLVRGNGDALYLPLGDEVDFFFEPPAGGLLRVEAVHRRATDRGWIEVWARLEGEGEDDVQLGRLEQAGETELALPAAEGRAIRLRLKALPEPGADRKRGTGLVLLRPMIAVPVDSSADGPKAEPASPHPAPGSAQTPRPFNVLVYLIDALRADRLGCYGHDRPVSPAIDAFAEDALLFEHAVAQSSWTRPAVASLFTGVWPGTHGVHGRRDSLAQEAVTLPEILHGYGYRTAGFVTNRNVARPFGFGQGFETYRMLRMEDTAAEVNARAFEWLGEWQDQGEGDDRAPFFLYLHTVEPHSPYTPPEPFRERFAPEAPRDGMGQRWWLKRLIAGEIEVTDELVGHLLDLYDAEIAANDESFGRLIGWLDEAGLLEETVIVLLSDHGEEFHERGRWEHGKSLHTEVIDVPLIVRFPGSEAASMRGKRISRPVQHIDVLPTLLSFLQLPRPTGIEGQDLMALTWKEAPLLSHLDLDGFAAVSVTTGEWRLIEGRSEPHGVGIELYDRRKDPKELENLVTRRPVTTGFLHTDLLAREWLTEGVLQAGEAQIDEETREQLRALGYLQ